jgi:tetratricopeptide (TPR) repeat protein
MAEKLTRKEKIALQKKADAASPKKTEKSASEVRSVKRILGLFVAIAGFMLYSNTLNHGYVLDDFGLIKDNTQTKKGVSAIPEIFKSSYRYGMNITDYTLYRPLTKAMFAAEWDASPDNPSLSHWVNVLLFSLLCFMLFLVLSSYMNGSLIVPFITSLLFAAHPLHTEVVANIKGRDEIVCFLLCISAIGLFRKYVVKNSFPALIAGVTLFFLAMFAKESAITFLAIVPMFYYFFTNADRKKYFMTLSGMIVCILIFLKIRDNVLDDVIALIPVEDNSLAGIKDLVIQKANAIYIMGVYLKMMVFPSPLIADGSYNHFSEVGLSSWKFLVPFIIFIAAGICAILLFKKKDPVSFSILFFFTTASIVSNVVMLIGTNYGERLMFIPSFGFCLLIAILLTRAFKSDSAQKVFSGVKTFYSEFSKPLLAVFVIVILFGIQTRARNADWKSDYTLYSTDVKKVPNSAHMLFYYANHISAEEYINTLPDSASRLQTRLEAIEHLTRAVSIYPKYSDGFQRRGFIYSQMKNDSLAEQDYKQALNYNHSHPIVYNNYGSLCFNQRRYDEAIYYFKEAIRYNPQYAHALNNVASVYGVYGLSESDMMVSDPVNKDQHMRKAREYFESAIAYFLKSIEADPNFSEPYRLVAITYRNIGDHELGDKYDRLYQEVIKRTNAKN